MGRNGNRVGDHNAIFWGREMKSLDKRRQPVLWKYLTRFLFQPETKVGSILVVDTLTRRRGRGGSSSQPSDSKFDRLAELSYRCAFLLRCSVKVWWQILEKYIVCVFPKVCYEGSLSNKADENMPQISHDVPTDIVGDQISPWMTSPCLVIDFLIINNGLIIVSEL